MKIIRTALLGLGTVNIGLLKILNSKKDYIAQKHGIEFIITAVADSSGVAINNDGFDYNQLINLKAVKDKVSSLPGFMASVSSESVTEQTNAELLIESSPVNLETGYPGLHASKLALSKGMHVVFANKAPLVLAFDELHELAQFNNLKIAYSATVCGGLPVINVLQRDLMGATLKNFKGILNATTNHILDGMEKGGSMEEGIKEAQRLGAAEADPGYDVSGHDTANKLFIIMKSFTDFNGTINDISIEGIENITAQQLIDLRQRGNTIKLIASAEQSNTGWHLSVKPTQIKVNTFLGNCDGWEMGIEFETNYYEKISMKIYEEDPIATSAAVFRDAILVFT